MRRVFRGLALVLGLVSIGSPVLADLYDDLEDLDRPKTVPPMAPKEDPDPSSGELGQTTTTLPATVRSPGTVTPTKTDTPPEPRGGRPAAKPSPPKAKGKQQSRNAAREPVRFESKGLQGSRDQGTIQLMEEVIVTQDDLRMESDKATVHFTQGSNEVQRVVASGNVKMFKTDPDTGKKIRAEANEVLFQNIERKLILKGNARLWRGEDLVRGKQITYEMNTGWVRADRVEGVVQPGDEAKPQSPSSSGGSR